MRPNLHIDKMVLAWIVLSAIFGGLAALSRLDESFDEARAYGIATIVISGFSVWVGLHIYAWLPLNLAIKVTGRLSQRLTILGERFDQLTSTQEDEDTPAPPPRQSKTRMASLYVTGQAAICAGCTIGTSYLMWLGLYLSGIDLISLSVIVKYLVVSGGILVLGATFSFGSLWLIYRRIRKAEQKLGAIIILRHIHTSSFTVMIAPRRKPWIMWWNATFDVAKQMDEQLRTSHRIATQA